MATITSEVFRFVNVRGPASAANTTTTPINTTKPKPVSRVMSKPDVIDEGDWNGLLVQQLITAKNDPGNEDHQREAMQAVLDAYSPNHVPPNDFYIQDESTQKSVELAAWIHTNATALDKATLRDKFIDVYNTGRDIGDQIDTSAYAATIAGVEIVTNELKVWDILVASTLKFHRPKLAEALTQALQLVHLAKELSDYDAFPTDTDEIYELFTAPIDLPTDIFPLPKSAVPDPITPTPDPRDAQLATAKDDFADWTAAQITLAFAKDQLNEKQQQLLHDFVVTYDGDGNPTNLDNTPKLELQYLTAATLDEYTQRCATTIGAQLTAGKALIVEQFLCSEESKYSFAYMEREVATNLKKLQNIIFTLTPRTVTKTVMVDGTIFTFNEVVRGTV